MTTSTIASNSICIGSIDELMHQTNRRGRFIAPTADLSAMVCFDSNLRLANHPQRYCVILSEGSRFWIEKNEGLTLTLTTLTP